MVSQSGNYEVVTDLVSSFKNKLNLIHIRKPSPILFEKLSKSRAGAIDAAYNRLFLAEFAFEWLNASAVFLTTDDVSHSPDLIQCLR